MTVSEIFVRCPVLLLAQCLLEKSIQGLKEEHYFTLGCLLSLDIMFQVLSAVSTIVVLEIDRPAILSN